MRGDRKRTPLPIPEIERKAATQQALIDALKARIDAIERKNTGQEALMQAVKARIERVKKNVPKKQTVGGQPQPSNKKKDNTANRGSNRAAL